MSEKQTLSESVKFDVLSRGPPYDPKKRHLGAARCGHCGRQDRAVDATSRGNRTQAVDVSA